METSEDMPASRDKRRWVVGLHSALAVDKAMVKGRAQWWDFGAEARRDVAGGSSHEGVDAAISAWAADHCKKVLGRESTEYNGATHVAASKVAEDRGLGAW